MRSTPMLASSRCIGGSTGAVAAALARASSAVTPALMCRSSLRMVSLAVALCAGWAGGQPCTSVITYGTYPVDGVIGVSAVSQADFNRDGRQDLAVALGNGTGEVQLLLGDGLGGFVAQAPRAAGGSAFDVATGDFNRDGSTDVAVSNQQVSGSVTVLLGTGSGGLGAPASFGAGTQPRRLTVADVDRDGRLDLVVTSASAAVSLLLGDGLGGFAPATSLPAGGASDDIVAADTDRNGTVDLVVVHTASSQLSILTGNGNGGFGAPVNYAVADQPQSVEVGDLDRDGRLDLVVTSAGAANLVSVLLGGAGGLFGLPTTTSLSQPPRDLVLEDFNADGELDAAVFQDDASSVLLGAAGLLGAPQDLGGVFGVSAGIVIHPEHENAWPQALVVVQADGSLGVVFNETIPPGNPGESLGPASGSTAALGIQAMAVSKATGPGPRELVALEGSYLTVYQDDFRFGLSSTFSAFPLGAGLGRALAMGRLNGDASLDAVVSMQGPDRLLVLFAAGAWFDAPIVLATGLSPEGVAIGDFDGDGNRDLSVANRGSASVRVYRSDGAGGFTGSDLPLPGSQPVAVTIADVNRDGRADLYVADQLAGVWVALGDGAGAFAAPVKTVLPASLPTGLASGDLDGDGAGDVVIADSNGRAWVLLADGAGGFSSVAPIALTGQPASVMLGRLDANASLDLAVGRTNSNSLAILLGDGSGGFAAPTSVRAGNGPTLTLPWDADHNGWTDLVVVSSGTNTLRLLVGKGDGTFEEAPHWDLPRDPVAALVGDLDRNGTDDLVVVTKAPSLTARVLLGDGSGGFSPGTSVPLFGQPTDTVLADFDRDARLDLAVLDSLSGSVGVRLGNGAGAWGPETTFGTGGSDPRSFTVSDFDRDGRLDLAIAHFGSPFVGILLGDGTGGFVPPGLVFTGLSSGGALDSGDLDRDGRPDLVLGLQPAQVGVLLGDGAGGFGLADVLGVLGPAINSLALVDFVNPGGTWSAGSLDIAVSSPDSSVLLLGDGAGGFATTPFPGSASPLGQLAPADLTRDWRHDFAVLRPADHDFLVVVNSSDYYLERAYAVEGQPTALASGDFDRDGRPDLVVTSSDPADAMARLTLLRNTRSLPRRLTVLVEPSSCGAPGVPFASQPFLGWADDRGGNPTAACFSVPASAAIAPGTGAPGAVLNGTTVVPGSAWAGAPFSDLSIDRPGRGYQLSFDAGPYGDALSRSFTLGLAPTILGPGQFCEGATVAFDGAAGFDAYNWNLDGGPSISTSRYVTLTGLAPGSHTLTLGVSQDGCPAGASLSLAVDATLTAVTASVAGSSNVCTACVGGTASVAEVGGGALARQWGYRTTPGGAITPIGGATGTTYPIAGTDFPGPGNYYLVETTTPTCGFPRTSTEIPLLIYVAGDDVQFLTVTSKSGTNRLEWINPAFGPYVATLLRYRAVAGSSACTPPSGPADGVFLAQQSAGVGARDSFTHGALLDDGTTYCYAAFVQKDGLPSFSPGRFAKGRPFDTSGPVKWAYNTGAAALTPPAVGPGVFVVSNDRVLHSMVRGAAGGNWPLSWTPLLLNAPSQARSPVVTTSAVPGAARVVFVGSQDGSLFAVNADSGAPLWPSAGRLGEGVQGSPVGLFASSGGAFDLVLAGTRNVSTDNRFVALAAINGTFVGTPFDNGGGPTSFGVVSGPAVIDSANRRLFFASRMRGSTNTLWRLEIQAGGVVPAWGVPLGDMDAAPTRRAGAVFAGNNSGVVFAVDAETGATQWSFPTGDGAVKGFVFPDNASEALYLSTATTVWGLTPGSAVPNWPPVTLPNPSRALFTPGGHHLLVGAADGRLYQLDLSTATPTNAPGMTSVLLGDGAAVVGSPTLDTGSNMVYVGTEAGIIYAVQLPLP